jgi:parvulin-like peptidyl-prolyl isomerase
MTFRTKPVVKRSHRPSWESDDRRNLFINIGFGVAIVIGVLALVGAGVATYVGDHFAEVASVNGTKISKDQIRDRTKVDAFRIDQAEAQIRDQLQLGRITDSEYQSRLAAYDQQRQSLAKSTIEQLIDVALQGQLAAARGIVVDDPKIDQRLVDEATHREQRHVLMISVTPELTAGAKEPTDAQKAAAKAKADKALADIRAGKPFEEIAKAVSTDAYATAGGDTGWALADDASYAEGFLAAIFALPQDGLTEVLAGADGTYRIGKVTEIAPQAVDGDWIQRIEEAGIPIQAYRDAVRGDLVRGELTAKVLAEVTEQPTAQRRVSEIFISTASYQGPGDEVKVRHILYTPGDTAPGSASPAPSGDPSWAAAKAKAQATYDKLKALAGTPDELAKQFAEIAGTDSKDTGSGASGGELPYYTEGQLDRGFADAIFKTGLKKGDLLPPVQSQYGWHVILFEDRRQPPESRANGIQLLANSPGADFAKLATEHSDGAEAAKGGDLGWIAKYQLDAEREAAIFGASVGKVSDVLSSADGFHLFLVHEEQTRKPDGDQLATLKSSGFRNWYTAQKANADIKRDSGTPTP